MPANPLAMMTAPLMRPLPRARFIPVGTTRAWTVPARGPRWLQWRRVRQAMEDHRRRGWEPMHDPRPPVYGPDGWLLTFQKVR